MPGLFTSLSTAARALEAQRFGLDVAGQNIANVNTPGYTRRQAVLAAVPPYEPLSAGNGVEVTGLRSIRDQRLDARLQQERPAEQRAAAIAQSLGVVETALGKPGESIDAAMSSFFDAFSQLSSDPTSANARRQVVSEGQALSASFKDMTSRLQQARVDADTGIRDGVAQVNELTSRIAKINGQLGSMGSDGPGVLDLKDQLNETLKELSGLIDIGTIARSDGGIDVTIGQGHPLVIGANQYSLDVASTPPSGFAALMSAGNPVTSEVTGGTIGGLIESRDSLIPGYLDQLDTLAYTIVSQVNSVHAGGYGLNGSTGNTFFTPLGSAAGAASAISVSAGIVADPNTIAAGATAVAGDNDVARSLAKLSDAKVLSGGSATFAESWGNLVFRVGSDSRAASAEEDSRGAIVQQIESLREQVSGVSLDEEAAMMMKFQRAYEANARFFQAVDSALDTLLSLGR